MLDTGTAFLNPRADVKHASPPRQNDTARLANTYFRAARSAERARCWLLAQTYRDEARRLLEIKATTTRDGMIP
jgi:hypothetical protein